mmetsp:Transcript_11410/g.12546  ORF Transcript_11410/g.12546 Transcript_11410/m.12546 type:complete len:342 (-) Transcript_11410:336-1361(-)
MAYSLPKHILDQLDDLNSMEKALLILNNLPAFDKDSKDVLKSEALNGNAHLSAALNVFMIDFNFSELVDTLQKIARDHLGIDVDGDSDLGIKTTSQADTFRLTPMLADAYSLDELGDITGLANHSVDRIVKALTEFSDEKDCEEFDIQDFKEFLSEFVPKLTTNEERTLYRNLVDFFFNLIRLPNNQNKVHRDDIATSLTLICDDEFKDSVNPVFHMVDAEGKFRMNPDQLERFLYIFYNVFAKTGGLPQTPMTIPVLTRKTMLMAFKALDKKETGFVSSWEFSHDFFRVDEATFFESTPILRDDKHVYAPNPKFTVQRKTGSSPIKSSLKRMDSPTKYKI